MADEDLLLTDDRNHFNEGVRAYICFSRAQRDISATSDACAEHGI